MKIVQEEIAYVHSSSEAIALLQRYSTYSLDPEVHVKRPPESQKKNFFYKILASQHNNWLSIVKHC